jgi:translation elongation factor EF-1beta
MSRLLAVIKILPEDDAVKLDVLKVGLKEALPKGIKYLLSQVRREEMHSA